MGGVPSHDAPAFLYTTTVPKYPKPAHQASSAAVSFQTSGGVSSSGSNSTIQKPTASHSSLTTDVCLVPLVRKHFNEKHQPLKDSMNALLLPTEKRRTRASGSSPPSPALPHQTAGSPPPPPSPIAADSPSESSNSDTTAQLPQLPSTPHNSSALQPPPSSKNAEEAEAFLAVVEKSLLKSLNILFDDSAAIRKEAEELHTRRTGIEKRPSEVLEDVTSAATEPTTSSPSSNTTNTSTVATTLRPVPCAICTIQHDNNNSNSNTNCSSTNTGRGNSSSGGAGGKGVGEALSQNSVSVQNRWLRCIGYVSCFSASCQYPGSKPPSSSAAAADSDVQPHSAAPQDEGTGSVDPNNSSSTAAAGCRVFKGQDVYLEVVLEDDEAYGYLIDAVLMLASVMYRSQFMNCAMRYRSALSSEVDDVYRHHLSLLNVHVMMPKHRYHLMKSLYEQVLLGTFADEVAMLQRSRQQRIGEEVLLAYGGVDAQNRSNSLGDADADLLLAVQEAAAGGGVMGAGRDTGMREGRFRNRRKQKRPLIRALDLAGSSEAFRASQTRSPQFSFYETEDEISGVEVVLDGDWLARYTKLIHSFSVIEMIRGSFIRCDLGPLMRERRNLHEVAEPADIRRVTGGQLVSDTIHTWLREGAEKEERMRQRQQQEEDGTMSGAAFPHPLGPTPSGMVASGILPPSSSLFYNLQTPYPVPSHRVVPILPQGLPPVHGYGFAAPPAPQLATPSAYSPMFFQLPSSHTPAPAGSSSPRGPQMMSAATGAPGHAFQHAHAMVPCNTGGGTLVYVPVATGQPSHHHPHGGALAAAQQHHPHQQMIMKPYMYSTPLSSAQWSCPPQGMSMMNTAPLQQHQQPVSSPKPQGLVDPTHAFHVDPGFSAHAFAPTSAVANGPTMGFTQVAPAVNPPFSPLYMNNSPLGRDSTMMMPPPPSPFSTAIQQQSTPTPSPDPLLLHMDHKRQRASPFGRGVSPLHMMQQPPVQVAPVEPTLSELNAPMWGDAVGGGGGFQFGGLTRVDDADEDLEGQAEMDVTGFLDTGTVL